MKDSAKSVRCKNFVLSIRIDEIEREMGLPSVVSCGD